MKQSMTARRQPLLVMITTAGTVRECIYDDTYDYACKVADEEIKDDHFLPILYELDNRNEWTDPTCWLKANPGLGTIKSYHNLSIEVERAKMILKNYQVYCVKILIFVKTIATLG